MSTRTVITTTEERRLNLTDAIVVANWLNAAQEAKAPGYKRVASIHQQLQELQRQRNQLRECLPDPQEDARARQKRAAQKAKLKPGQKPESVILPSYRDSGRAAKLIRQMNALISSLNESLSQYTFRPQIAQLRLGYTVLENLWSAGMAADSQKSFQLRISGLTISEADVALALVRLDLVGEVSRVGVCEQCQRRWRVAAKTHYRFCSKQCRLEFYAADETYRKQRVATQQRYRDNLKQRYRDSLKSLKAMSTTSTTKTRSKKGAR